MEENITPSLEQDLIACFKKRNIEVVELHVTKGSTLYEIKVKR